MTSSVGVKTGTLSSCWISESGTEFVLLLSWTAQSASFLKTGVDVDVATQMTSSVKRKTGSVSSSWLGCMGPSPPMKTSES